MKDEGEPLILWTAEEYEELLAKGAGLYAHPENLADYAGPALMAHTLLLDESFRRLIKKAGSAAKLDESLKMVALAYKGHEAWRGIMDPLSKRVLAGMKKEIKGGGTAKQVPGSSGPRRLTTGRRTGTGAGESGAEAHAGESGRPGEVEVEPVGLPDGDGPGHGGSDHQDARPAEQEEPTPTVS